MEKRYQVFISSTFVDLKEERQAVLKAILELNHMPAGMELFPAADDSAWQLIKDVIDASDYYVVIIGGRYGSLDETGLGFTEKEYDCAVKAKKPVISLLHQNPDNLPRGKTETDAAAWDKLQAFRAKVEKRHTCVYWTSAEDLKAKVIVGLTSTMKRHPCVGWIRADLVPTEATIAEVLTLRNRIADLEDEMAAARVSPPSGTGDLEQGDDPFEISFSFDVSFAASGDGLADDMRSLLKSILPDNRITARLTLAWNEIFAAIAPTMISEASDEDLLRAFRRIFERRAMAVVALRNDMNGKNVVNYHFDEADIMTCIVQFRALGLMRESKKQRSVKDTSTYWALTPYGDYLMTQLRARRRAWATAPAPDGEARTSSSETDSE